MLVQTVWIYIPAHMEAEGATVISEYLQDGTNPDLDLRQTEKTNLVLDQEKAIASNDKPQHYHSHETGK